jgi:putative PIN family toxin of toxin-antitoxin system
LEVRAVLDANVVVDGFLNRRRASAQIMRALFKKQFTACATTEVLAEYSTALRSRSVMEFARSRGLHANFVQMYAEEVANEVELVEPGPRFRSSDPDDDMYTAASSGARAEFLVSSDPALLDLGTVLEAAVVTPERFEGILAR